MGSNITVQIKMCILNSVVRVDLREPLFKCSSVRFKKKKLQYMWLINVHHMYITDRRNLKRIKVILNINNKYLEICI